MNKPWTVDDSRRVIALLLIVFCMYLFWILFKSCMVMFDVFKSQKVSLFDFAYSIITRYFVTIFVYFLILFAGITFFLKPKIGWIMSLIVLITLGFLYVYRLFIYHDNDPTYKTSITLTFITGGVWGSITLLLSKPFRVKYAPGKATWLTIFLSVCALLLVRMI